jgi:hypothetical protein
MGEGRKQMKLGWVPLEGSPCWVECHCKITSIKGQDAVENLMVGYGDFGVQIVLRLINLTSPNECAVGKVMSPL